MTPFKAILNLNTLTRTIVFTAPPNYFFSSPGVEWIYQCEFPNVVFRFLEYEHIDKKDDGIGSMENFVMGEEKLFSSVIMDCKTHALQNNIPFILCVNGLKVTSDIWAAEFCETFGCDEQQYGDFTTFACIVCDTSQLEELAVLRTCLYGDFELETEGF